MPRVSSTSWRDDHSLARIGRLPHAMSLIHPVAPLTRCAAPALGRGGRPDRMDVARAVVAQAPFALPRVPRPPFVVSRLGDETRKGEASSRTRRVPVQQLTATPGVLSPVGASGGLAVWEEARATSALTCRRAIDATHFESAGTHCSVPLSRSTYVAIQPQRLSRSCSTYDATTAGMLWLTVPLRSRCDTRAPALSRQLVRGASRPRWRPCTELGQSVVWPLLALYGWPSHHVRQPGRAPPRHAGRHDPLQ